MYHVIYNPVAGRGRTRRALAEVESFLADRGLPYAISTTTRTGHARELVDGLPSDARVLSLGGDGTAHEVAAAVVGTDRVMGVIPSGSGDDFAFALGLERHDVRAALEIATRGLTRSVDVGVVNDQPFVNAMGVGFDADVAAHVRSAPAFLRGPGAYLWAIFAAMKDFALAEARVEVDGAPVHEGKALLVAVQNGPRSGGSFLFAPPARIDDGVLDVVIAGSFTRAGAIGILPRLIRGTHLDHPSVRLVRGERVTVEWSRPRTFHMEGELAPPEVRLNVCVRQGGLRVFS